MPERRFDGCGLHAWFGFDLPPAEGLNRILDKGFDTVMLFWSDDYAPKNELLNRARQLGLRVANGHLPFAGVDQLWLEGAAGDAWLAYWIRLLEDADRADLRLLVVHPAGSQRQPPVSQIGLERFASLVQAAEQHAITLALENICASGHWQAILNALDSPRLGVCYDVGHNHVGPRDPTLLLPYLERLVAVHLHDNDGSADQHLIPFDGDVDWAAEMRLIRSSNYRGPLTLEVMGRPEPDPDTYLERAWSAAQRLFCLG